MFRQFKLAGAHPDILWSVDAVKAQHNGDEMARLETLFHLRASKGPSALSQEPPQRFFFWLAPNPQHSAASPVASPSCSLRKVELLLHPSGSSHVVHQQLEGLFREAGIMDSFTLGEAGVDMTVESLLHYADKQQSSHIKDAGALYIRAEKAVEQLREHGVVVVVSDDNYSYLVTMPEAGARHLTDNTPPPAQQCCTPSPRPGARPWKSIVSPTGEIDPAVQEYMMEHGLRPFELRLSGSQSGIEGFVSAFERLERLYEVHRGKALRPGVCLVLRLPPRSPSPHRHYVAKDGCVVLSLQHREDWDTFLLSLSQNEWNFAVQQQREWRVGTAPKWADHQRQLKRLASAFGFFRLRLEAPLGGTPRDAPAESSGDASDILASLLREEVAIRKTLARYHVSSKVLQKRGTLILTTHLNCRLRPDVSIGYRLLGDGTVFFNMRQMKVPQMLRVLRDNVKRIEANQLSYDNATATLEHLSRALPIDFSIDAEWKVVEESQFNVKLQRFVDTIKTHQHPIAALLHSVSSGGEEGKKNKSECDPQAALREQLEYEAGKPLPAHSGYRKAFEKRYVWVISDKLNALPTGVLYIPFNVDFPSLKRCLLPK